MNSSISIELFTANTPSNFSLTTNNGNSSVIGTSVSQLNGITFSLVVKSAIFYVIMLISMFGNSLILIAIWKTPSLKTKTNKLLASLTISDFWAGGAVLYYVPFNLITSLNPCAYNVTRVFVTVLINFPPYASCFNLIFVAIDRYVAIVHPLEYEIRMTDVVINCMIAGTWLLALLCASYFTLWLINADRTVCVLLPSRYYFINPCVYMLVSTFVTFVYLKILLVAWHQHVAIEQSTAGVASLPVTVNAAQSNLQESDSVSNVVQQQHTYQQKAQKAQFKALRLTSVIIGAFLLLWFPYQLGRVLQFVGDTRPIVGDLVEIGLAIGMFNASINWILYGASSKAYQKAFKRLLSSCLGY